jgi:hypothetical protein
VGKKEGKKEEVRLTSLSHPSVKEGKRKEGRLVIWVAVVSQAGPTG